MACFLRESVVPLPCPGPWDLLSSMFPEPMLQLLHLSMPQDHRVRTNQSQSPVLSSLPKDSGGSLATATGILFWKLSSWLRLQQLPLSQQDVPSPPPPSNAHKPRVPGTPRKSGLTIRVDGGQEGRGQARTGSYTG